MSEIGGGGLTVLILFAAAFTEWVVERIFGSVKALKGHPMVLLGAAVGVALSFGFKLDGLSLVGFDGGYASWMGYLMTGLVIGAGASAVHKMLKKV